MADKLKHKSSVRYFDGRKSIDIWNGDEGWTILSGDTQSTATADYYKFIPTLYRGSQIRSYSVSTMPFEILKGKTVYDSSQDYQNKVEFLPNPAILLQLIESALVMCGRAYLFRDRNQVMTKGLRYHLPTSVTPVINEKTGELDNFRRPVNGMDKFFKPDDYIYFWLPDPYVEVGVPINYPAQAAANACGVLKGMDVFAANFFERGAIKAMLLGVKGMPSETERKKLEDWWRRVVAGVKNAFAASVFNAEAITPTVVGEGVKELENVTIGADKREDISIALGIPMSILFANAANYATSKQDELNFLNKTIIPECEFIASVLNDQLFTDLGLHFNFLPETLDAMQEDETARAGGLKQLTDAGVPLLMAMDILGYELDEKQRAELEQAVADKKLAAERAAEALRQAANKPPEPQQQPGDNSHTSQNAQDNQPVPAKSLLDIDLEKWERKALKALAKSGCAAVDFESDNITAEVHFNVAKALADAATVEAVKAAFMLKAIADDRGIMPEQLTKAILQLNTILEKHAVTN